MTASAKRVATRRQVHRRCEPFLRTYLTEARPILADRRTGYDYISPRIADATRRAKGVRVPPHFFRDAAATTLVHIFPRAARLIPSVLGHNGTGTADRHYIHTRTIETGRDDAALIAARKTKER